MNFEQATKRAGITTATLLLGMLVLRLPRSQPVELPVAGGSMAPTLNGKHYEVECADCRFRFACDFENSPTDGEAICPNCGFGGNPMLPKLAKRGDAVTVDRSVFGQRSPRRWEIVAYERDSKLEVKRVTGLPGEHVAIRDGDIYINGQILRKSLSEQRALAVLVHDDQFRARQAGWRGNHRWAATASGHQFTPRGAASHWLTYRPWTPAHARAYEVPVKDLYAYNQGLRRDPITVSDLMLTCKLEVSGTGVFACGLHDGRDWLTAKLAWPGLRLTLMQGSRPIGSAHVAAKFAQREVRILLSIFDRQLTFCVNGEIVWQTPYERSAREWRPTARPAHIEVGGLEVEVAELRLYRDLHYFAPTGSSHDWRSGLRLAADEFFVLGDNVPLSVDSRHWASGQLRRKSLVGKVLETSGMMHRPAAPRARSAVP